jgi:ribosomal protein S18 acetylase RimI-like enzyme
MEIRALKIPRDADAMMESVLASFQYPENPAWSIDEAEKENLRDQINSIKRYWPFLRVGGLFSRTLRHLLDGYVCEDGGKIAATMLFQKRPANPPVYYISNVSVRPEYRRRGIARKMIEKALAAMRAAGNCTVLLDVISGNLPAYNLYESMGWEHFSGDIHLILDGDKPASKPERDTRYEWVTLPAGSWKTRYEFAQRVIPAGVRRYVPVKEADYRSNRLMNLLESFVGVKPVNAVLRSRESGQTAAMISYSFRTRPGGSNSARLTVDPGHISAIPYLLDALTGRVQAAAPGRKLELMAAAWQPEVAGCALAKGFVKRYEFHTLGLRIE